MRAKKKKLHMPRPKSCTVNNMFLLLLIIIIIIHLKRPFLSLAIKHRLQHRQIKSVNFSAKTMGQSNFLEEHHTTNV